MPTLESANCSSLSANFSFTEANSRVSSSILGLSSARRSATESLCWSSLRFSSSTPTLTHALLDSFWDSCTWSCSNLVLRTRLLDSFLSWSNSLWSLAIVRSILPLFIRSFSSSASFSSNKLVISMSFLLASSSCSSESHLVACNLKMSSCFLAASFSSWRIFCFEETLFVSIFISSDAMRSVESFIRSSLFWSCWERSELISCNSNILGLSVA
mmetsp:Transcript_34050/g.72554  ORF Transcript_34050/g.72554 Transcript_34050/m.72554 type:complete len:214 (+) Transcript_34050:125-766(+)